MKINYSISQWIYPFFLGVVIFNFLRLATDLLKDNSFWVGSLKLHIISQICLIIMCYLFDIKSRSFLNKKIATNKKNISSLKEYTLVLASASIFLNLICLTGQYIGIFYMGNGIIDYVILNVISLPLLLLYYAMVRNEMINRNYNEQYLLLEQIKNKQFETELDYLKAQYHPHFLFNALNTIYFQINEDNPSAKKTIELLSELLRYQLYEVNKIVTMSEEINFIRAYIQFQKLRMSERLKIAMNIDPLLNEQKIHPLLFQPLLENAFKYVGGNYLIEVNIHLTNNKVVFTIINSLPELNPDSKKNKKGIGIENVKRRLELLYPGKHSLQNKQKNNFFCAILMIDLNGNKY